MIEFVNRKGSNCYKWDSEEAVGKLPLWVADMDFKAAPAIINALKRRINHGVFGYAIAPDEYFDAVSSWFSRRHGWSGISRANSIPTTGVVPAISAVLKARIMEMQDKGKTRQLRVMTFTPAYNCFFSSIKNMEAELIDCPLINDNGLYRIDFSANCEQAIKKADVLLLCNPHNPTGRVWTKDELQTLAVMCKTHDTYIISDEIHCEFMMPGKQYTPFATVAEKGNRYCVMTSASKAFNIAGLQCANIFVPDSDDYQLIDRAINIHEVCDPNLLGIVATIAAYNESELWIDELNEHIYQNYILLADFLEHNLPQLKLTTMEGTYLAWVNIEALGISAELFCHELAHKENVLFNPSEMYGATGYIRINLATSKEILTEALIRLNLFVNNEITV